MPVSCEKPRGTGGPWDRSPAKKSLYLLDFEQRSVYIIGMSLYEDIAGFYDEIFPLRKNRLPFVESFIKEDSANIIDIGCATGELAFALTEKNHRVTGIDLDLRMVEIARKKAGKKNIETMSIFKSLDMRDIAAVFNPDSFNIALCFGNTLPHLQGVREVKNFFESVFSVLQKKGILLFQTVNFECFFLQGIHELPVIENRDIRFDRHYDYSADVENRSILFTTTLTIKKTGKIIKSSVPLTPIKIETLNELLEHCGFDHIKNFENESKKVFSPQSASCITVAEKR